MLDVLRHSRAARVVLLVAVVGLVVPIVAGASGGPDSSQTRTVSRFVFGTERSGWTPVDRGSPYDPDRGWGYSRTRTFSVRLPAGDYAVSLVARRPLTVSAESINAVPVGSRREGGTVVTDLTVALIDGRLDLTLGPSPAEAGTLESVTITREATRAPGEIPTLFLIGDSTVQTYTDADAPLTGWGQVIGRFLDPSRVSVDNHARYGRSTRTYVAEGRLDAVLQAVRPGDYVAVQLGHNDAFTRPERHTSVATYSDNLIEYVDGIRQRGAVPILITPMVMRHPTFGGVEQSFPAYVAAMKQVAADHNVALVDLNASSHQVVSTLGVGESRALYLHADAGWYSAYEAGVDDDIHFSPLGAAEMARLVATGLRDTGLPIAAAVRDVDPAGGVLAKPTGLAVVGPEFGALRLRWQPVAGADAYRIWARDDTAGAASNGLLVRSVLGSDAAVLGLATGHRYTIWVTAVAVGPESVLQSTESSTVSYDPAVERRAN